MLSRRTKRAWLGLIFLGLAVLLLFVSVGRFFQGQQLKRRYAEEKADLKPRPPNIYTIRDETRTRQRRYPAELAPWVDAQVPAEVSGKVVGTPCETGQRVEKGDTLVLLDKTLSELAWKASQAQHLENERLLSEAERLAERNVAAPTDLGAARSRVAISAADLAQKAETLARHEIRAPFTGIVDRRLVDVGDPVVANEPVVRLADIDRLRAIFYTSDQDQASFREGAVVSVRLPGVSGAALQATIRHVGRVADPDTRMFRMEAELPNPGQSLAGRSPAIVEAEVGIYRDTPFVPAAAVRISGRDMTVERINADESVQKVTVQAGPEVDGSYPVLEGLKAGDRILIR